MPTNPSPIRPAAPVKFAGRFGHYNRNNRCSLDIGEKEVRIIRTNRAGVIVKAAAVELSVPMTEKPDEAYVLALTRAIKQVRRKAGLLRIWRMPCVLVTGGPYVIIRRFTWPELPPAALLTNTRAEIAPYLPEDISAYTVHYRILRRHPKTEAMGETLDILTVAIPINIPQALTTAARKAGFTPVRLDIHENARGKLTRFCPVKTIDEDTRRFTAPSYAVLDIENTQINMTLCLEQVFYSNRFFSSSFINTADSSGDSDNHLKNDNEFDFDFDFNFTADSGDDVSDTIHVSDNISVSNAGDVSDTSDVSDAGYANDDSDANTQTIVYDADKLANEITSIIDFIHYRERGSRVEYILLIGDDEKVPGIHQSLTDNLEIPVYRVAEWFPRAFVRKKVKCADVSPYIDALGATMPVARKTAGPPHRLGADIDLRPPKKPNPAMQMMLPLLITLPVLAILLFIGITLPTATLQRLKLAERELDKELLNHHVAVDDIARLSRFNIYMDDQIKEVAQFYRQYPAASKVLRVIYEPRQTDEIFYTVKSADGVVTITGETADFNRLAQHLTQFYEHTLFANVRAETAAAYTEYVPETYNRRAGTIFTITLTLQPGTGVIK